MSTADGAPTPDSANAELRRRFMATIERTQHLPPSQMTRYQERLLEPLLRHAAEQVPFFRDGRLAPVLRPEGGLDMTRWHDIPILTRADVLAMGDRLYAERLPEMAGDTNTDSTSGSTGVTIHMRRSAAQLLASDCCSRRHLDWHHLAEDAVYALLSFRRPDSTDAPPLPGGRRAVFQSISDATVDVHAWLRDSGARYVTSYPTAMAALARDILAGQRPPLHLDAVQCYGEVLTLEDRQAIARGFGARVIDRYAAEEVGLIAGECPDGGLHVPSEINLVEIVDDAGRPVPAGAPGRVVVTAFYSYAMPFIRYALGDYAIATTAPCRCGRTLPTLDRVLGRVRDLFHFADGSRVWPLALSGRMAEFVPSLQYQVVQHSFTDIEFRYRPMPDSIADLAGAAAYMRSCLHPDVAVRFTVVETIPREANGKYRDYVCLLPTQAGA